MNQKTKKNIALATIAIGIVAILYILFKDTFKSIGDTISGGGGDGSTGGSQDTTVTLEWPTGTVTTSNGNDVNKQLSNGSKGNEVGELQKQLNNYLAHLRAVSPSYVYIPPNLVVDKAFGPATLAVLQSVTQQTSISLLQLNVILKKKMGK